MKIGKSENEKGEEKIDEVVKKKSKRKNLDLRLIIAYL